MAKLIDKLMNRVIKGKLTIESGDDVSGLDLSEVDLHVKSINAKGGAISGPLAVTGNSAIGGDLDVNGDLRAKTLSQTQANYSFDLEEYIVPTDTTNLEVIGEPFVKIKVINGCLHIVGCFRVKNNDENSSHAFTLGQIQVTVPESIGSHIMNHLGYAVTESGHAGFIRNIIIAGSDGSVRVIRLNNTSNSNELQFYMGSYINIDANDYTSFSFDVTLTIV